MYLLEQRDRDCPPHEVDLQVNLVHLVQPMNPVLNGIHRMYNYIQYGIYQAANSKLLKVLKHPILSSIYIDERIKKIYDTW